MFMTPEEEQPSEAKESSGEEKAVPPKGYIMQPEPRARRLQVLLQPSLFNELDKAAKANDLSYNEIVHRALWAYLDDDQGKEQ